MAKTIDKARALCRVQWVQPSVEPARIRWISSRHICNGGGYWLTVVISELTNDNSELIVS